MQIILKKDTTENTYTMGFIKARILRTALTISKEVNFNDIDDITLDTLIRFLCEVYNNQFTPDDVYDGLAASELMNTLLDTLSFVIRGTTDILDELPNEEAGK